MGTAVEITTLDSDRSGIDFRVMHDAIQRYVDEGILCGVASVVLRGTEVIDRKTWGLMDLETRELMRDDAIFRIYSNTKIVTSVAAMMLKQRGCFQLDDPISDYIPGMRNPRVLTTDAKDVSQTEGARALPTVRQLMCHNAGFSYGFLQESVVDPEYDRAGVLRPDKTLEETVDALAGLPLAYQPGARWQYSVSTDVLARLVEIWSGQSFGDFLQNNIFEPLGMADTDFWVPPAKLDRLTTNYAPIDVTAPMQGGLRKVDDRLVGSYLEERPFQSGGGGLVSTLTDYTRFIQMIVGGGVRDGVRILDSETLDMMRSNQLPDGVGVQLPNWFMPNTVFGLGFALKTGPADGEPSSAIDECHWGGMAGTHSWMAPRAGISGLIFTQRLPGFWHPFSHEFKRCVYAACS